MTHTGIVTAVRRRVTDHGSVFMSVTLDGTQTIKYLHTFNHVPAKGERVTVEGTPIVGRRDVNLGGVRVTREDAA